MANLKEMIEEYNETAQHYSTGVSYRVLHERAHAIIMEIDKVAPSLATTVYTEDSKYESSYRTLWEMADTIIQEYSRIA